ncbi:hypothetical protein [Fructobacillus americanaquae]|uniref:Phage protein n=1 Tax=Fructobacillus americanaquae TaxID=2940302 RepID=A0ABY5C0I6_9LACO|nr:hypothetical protein [Fructobacillus americanaquae]USS91991.1 hypothetical protein M3M36_06685 [Fructobacillus americanaquae]
MTDKKVERPAEYESSTTAQNETNKRWAEKNKEHKKDLSYRTDSRSFIRKLATEDDFNELEQLIQERRTNVSYD